ncbi:MAG: glycosyltransferase family 4 protein [Clostridiales bacterium]|nr:glycosyltransferase family 4 protein [Clostridiales bacterium]
MSRVIWVLNHYAGNMFITNGGRHYYLSKYLKIKGYNPVVFCSNFDHFTKNNCVESNSLWVEKTEKETNVPYVFVKTSQYNNNGMKRVFNMVDFYRRVIKSAIQYAKTNGCPDVIYASSVHPLTLVAGIKLAKKYKVKCVSEVRDLWPESIVAYSSKLSRKNLFMRLLYAGEKWIYKKSDCVIMTWPGGYDYIKDQKWDNVIPESKVVHISNGIDLDSFNSNISNFPFEDSDLSDSNIKNFVYTGSVKKVNNLSFLVDAAAILKEKQYDSIKILVFGDGDELETLRSKAADLNLNNIVFKGRIPKQSVPSVLSQSYATILHNKSTELNKYGQSQNKLFEYMASGKPILMTYSVGHSVIKENNCGIELDKQDALSIAQAIIDLSKLSAPDYKALCSNAEFCSKRYDYKSLCNQLISTIENYF